MPVWNNSVGGITADGGVFWTNLGNLTTPVSPTYSFNWIETASVRDIVGDKWVQMETKIDLALDNSDHTRPRVISAQGDDGTGNIVFRLMPTPNFAYPVVLTLQQRAPVFSSLFKSWTPIPDEYAHIYNWGFLALFFLFSDDPRFQLANQKFVTSLLATNDGLTDTEMNIFLGNWAYVTGQPVEQMMRTQQGNQARAV